MSGKAKVAFLLVIGGLAIVTGEYAAGVITLRLLGLGDEPTGWVTYWRYWQAIDLPAYVPYAGTIKLGGALGFGGALSAWLGLAVLSFRARGETTHGDARFAGYAELRKAGLFTQTPQSILIGKYKGRELWLGGAQHVITISPTRSGKTTSIAIPVLLSYEHSMVVLDLKGELYKATSGWRESKGQHVRIWAPYDEHGKTHRFSPMTTLADMPHTRRIGEIQTMAAILYPDAAGQDPFWVAQSRAAFTAFVSYMFEAWDHAIASSKGVMPDPNTHPEFPSFERVLRFSSGEDGGGTMAMLQALLKDPKRQFISTQTRTVFSNLTGLAEQTFSSVMASMHAPLQQFLSPILAAATNATDIDVRSLRRKLTTLYVIIPTNKLDESAKLLNIFFSTVIGNNLDKQLGEEPDLKYQMLMLMDEFTAMGRVDVWAKRISIAASYGVRDLCIVQSRSQLRAAYGDHDAQNFITNHGAQIVFAPREQADANEYSDMLGYKTVRKQQRSTSHGGGGRQVSTNHIEERRALMLPQEVKELPADEELIFYEGCKPIRARKNWFFKDKAFKARSSLPPVAVHPQGTLSVVAEKPKAIAPAQGRALACLGEASTRTTPPILPQVHEATE
ncbi:type IV secretory system conjugative DNA transfer family protein [Luteibacter sp. UNCMF366Tsu5.1]|uniref:type IV secretory system conjugative DNA transfer family protein n=1 Tax=Luteibacter sp. UNCMF366Tsu5.1 TaxID=1502758 RepID=UPI0009086B57|nr:type IV secretory system conjugative DNA transfer family protein [Luteibacter sp. UNCMF366Tsu5.1]SFW68365.1 type IV secretion system protein VirD4 [Luteibacter sp. UNCMF366Tsu5.1]